MRVVMGIPDQAGCGHYRIMYPGRALEAEGHEVELAKEMKDVTMSQGTVIKVPPVEADVLVMQRPLQRLNVEMLAVIREQGVAVVVDVDDDFNSIDPQHFAWRRYQPRFSPVSNREHLSRACQIADLVTVTTPALAQRYGAHGRTAVLPNCIPKAMLGTVPAQKRDGNTVGWPGHVATHPNDLQATRGGVAMAVREERARFLNVGNGDGVRAALDLDEEPAVTGSQEFEDYPHAVAQLDVGIAPLADTKFNEAKSALKGMEMAAVGVPFIASPTADYRRIAAEGIGHLAASKSRSWRRAVLDLLQDESLREERAMKAREALIDKHLMENNAWRWVEAYEQAIRNRHNGRS